MRALILIATFLFAQDPEPDSRIGELRGQLKDETANVRGRAVRELTKLNAKETAPDIRPLLKDQDWEVRYFSLLALTQFDDRESAPAVKELLRDPEPNIIVAAAAAHAAWSTDAGLEDLGPLLKH